MQVSEDEEEALSHAPTELHCLAAAMMAASVAALQPLMANRARLARDLWWSVSTFRHDVFR